MLTPRSYQLEAIEYAQRKNALIADECGLGKTLVAIETAKEFVAQIHKPALIVLPKTLRSQWYAALINQGITPDRILIVDTFDTSQEITNAIAVLEDATVNNSLDQSFILVHYECLVKHIDTLCKTFYAVIIADEAHRIKNKKAQRTIALKRLQSYRRIAMSGTPYDKNPADIWSILNWLDPIFFKSYWNFFNAHIDFKEINTKPSVKKSVENGRSVTTVTPGVPVKIIKGVKDLDRFSLTLHRNMIRRYKKDVAPELPPRIDTVISIEMNKDQARVYNKIKAIDDITADIDGVEFDIRIVLTHILRLMQCTSDPTILDLKASSAKLEYLKEWLEDNQDQSVIVFTKFRDVAEKIHKEILPEAKLIIGGKNKPQIDHSVTRIVGTIAAMSEGLSLEHIDNAIFIDLEWSSILMQQALDRIHRINITAPKNVYYLICSGTVDELVYNALQNKWDNSDLINAYLKGVVNNAS